MPEAGRVVILGVFVADTAYRAERMPRMGETVLGQGFALGPGGKGSNQAVAAARVGADCTFITRLGADAFADMARATWAAAGVKAAARATPDSYTGAAFIYLDSRTGDNAIIIAPGAAALIGEADIAAHAALIAGAAVFVTQLEQPMPAAMAGLRLARAAGALTILNPAPAATLPEGMLALCDLVTPNETEAEALTGVAVHSLDDAARAAKALRAAGAGAAIVTLGARGAFYCGPAGEIHAPAFDAGPVVETTGAGDAFNGALAAAMAEGMAPAAALRFACAAASISVTRPGTAPAMPSRAEVEALLARG